MYAKVRLGHVKGGDHFWFAQNQIEACLNGLSYFELAKFV